MGYRGGIVEGVFFVRWVGAPTLEDNDRLVQELRAAAARGKVVYVAIIDDKTAMPDAAVRDRMLELAGTVLESASSMELVLAGSGVGMQLIRTVIRGMMMVSQRKLGPAAKDRVRLHADVTAALTAGKVQTPVAGIVAAARQQGFCDG